MRCPPFILAAMVSLLGACASSPAPKKAPDYGERVAERIAAESEAESFVVRYNPTPCNCPAWEIRLDGTWHRVAFDADPEAPVMVELEEGAKKTPLATWNVRGSLDDDLKTCARGAVFVTLSPAEIVVPGAEGEGEGDANEE